VIRILVLLYLGALAFLSLNPWIKPSAALAFAGLSWDKIDHAIAYGGLTVLLVPAFGRALKGNAPLLLAVLAASAIGLATEFCQAWFTEGRMFSYFDASANGAGALIAAAALAVACRLSPALRQSFLRLRA
jgi:VanZ family protein